MSRNSDFVNDILSKVRNLGNNDDDIRYIINLLLNWNAGYFPSNILAGDIIPDGYTITRDVLPSEFKVSDLEIGATFRMDDMVKCKDFNLGLADAKRIIDEQSDFPTSFRGMSFIFPGTRLKWTSHITYETYRNFHGEWVFPCINFKNDHWCLYFCDCLTLQWNTYHLLRHNR